MAYTKNYTEKFKLGDKVKLTKKVAGYFSKGSIVEICDIDDVRGYGFKDEQGNRVIECGWDCCTSEMASEMATTKNLIKWQTALDNEGLGHITVIDKNQVDSFVGGKTEIFSRDDEYFGNYFGNVSGDWRMIKAIADDIQYAFSLF